MQDTGSRHSLDTDEQNADRNLDPDMIGPDQGIQRPSLQAGPVEPGSITTGGAAAASPELGKATSHAHPLSVHWHLHKRDVPKLWGRL